MRIIGLTGGIACGKSNISDMLSSLGCVIIDGDKLSRELTVPGGKALPFLRDTFGPSVFREDGSLNRKALGSLVFSDRSALAALDSVMQPLLLQRIRERIAEEQARGTEFCVLDMPLLYEKKLDSMCDTVWCTWLPADVQLSRLMIRDGLNKTQALQRISSQMPVDEKASRSAVVISTEGTIEETRAKIPSLLEAERSFSVSAGTASPRRRRAERYSDTDTVAGQDKLPEPPSSAAHMSSRVVSPEAPGIMERPAAAKNNPVRRKESGDWRMPVPVRSALIALFFILLTMFASVALMKGYLKQEADKREAAYRKVVANHPISWRDSIEKYAAEFNLQPGYVSAIIMNESSFRPTAESSVGARGLMQLMPDTAEWIAHKLRIESYSFDRMKDPETNIRFGCWYLNYLSGLFRGDPVCVTAAYHAGQGQVISWLSNPDISPDGITLDLNLLSDGPTKTYIGRVTQDYGIYNALYFTEETDSEDSQPADADVSVADVSPV